MENKDFFFFIDHLESAAFILDDSDQVAHSNAHFLEKNKHYGFFDLKGTGYQPVQIDSQEWFQQLRSCKDTGSAKFGIKFCFYECTMLSMTLGNKKYILVNFFENKSQLEMNQLAAVAHEINNPLTIISARAQILKQNLHDQKPMTNEVLLQSLEKIYAQSERIRKIVDEMRSVAKKAA